MDAAALVIGLVVGALAGGAVAWFAAGSREREARVRAEAQLAAAAGSQTLLDLAERRLNDSFQAAAQQALQGNSRLFLDLAQQTLGQKETAIDGLVKPLQIALQQYEQHLASLERLRQSSEAALDQRIKALAEANDRLQRETGNLATALRSPTVRGRWGELALRRVAELAGMTAHCDFEEQATVATDGGRLRPDMTVHLPGGRTLVVDSKVSADGYLNALAATTEDERQAALAVHARQLRAHVQALAAKAYWDQFAASPDFVVMFVAVEPSVGSAMAQDTSLFEDALAKRVIIATPSFLIALLLTVAHAWRQERMAQNAEEVSKAGKELYDRMGVLTRHLSGIGKHLGRTVESYNQAVGSLQTRVLPSAQRLRDLGVAGSADLPAVAPVTTIPREPAPVLAAPDGVAVQPPAPAAQVAETPTAAARRPRINMNPDDLYGDF